MIRAPRTKQRWEHSIESALKHRKSQMLAKSQPSRLALLEANLACSVLRGGKARIASGLSRPIVRGCARLKRL